MNAPSTGPSPVVDEVGPVHGPAATDALETAAAQLGGVLEGAALRLVADSPDPASASPDGPPHD